MNTADKLASHSDHLTLLVAIFELDKILHFNKNRYRLRQYRLSPEYVVKKAL